jgi:hypothetical protein
MKRRRKESWPGELDMLREMASLRLSYTVAGQTIIGPVKFEDLYIMLQYGYVDQDMKITEEIARGVQVEHRIWNPRYKTVMGERPEKL